MSECAGGAFMLMACVERQVCPYPPGIPVLLPGERVTDSAVRELRAFRCASNSKRAPEVRFRFG